MNAHPAADTFPMMTSDELKTLAEDIRAQGLHRPIVLLDGLILDGRNRFEACKLAGVTPRFVQFDGDDPWAYVWSENAERRHLRPDQRVACRLGWGASRDRWLATQQRVADDANRKRSEATKAQPRTEDGLWLPTGVLSRDKTPDRDGWTHKQLATEANVSLATAARVQSLANSRPDLLRQVADGAMSAVQALRQKKHEEIASRTPGLPTGRYRVLYADPPWKYGNSMPDYAPEPGDHYPLMSIADLCALPIKDMAEDNAVLFLWVTSPILEEAFQVIKAWGFQYKASFVWDKIKHNMGHYNSVRHEFLLVCVRGSCQPDVAKLFDSVQSIERTAHSVKPEEFRQIIEALYPHGKRIELFARRPVPGWEVYGNEC